MPRVETDLYDILEKVLKSSKQPMDCVELFEHADVRKYATSSNRVSDYLGNMWRRGDVTRLPAPSGRDSRTRWMYMWKGRKIEMPDAANAVNYEPTVLLHKAAIKITEDGSNITIDLPQASITIRMK